VSIVNLGTVYVCMYVCMYVYGLTQLDVVCIVMRSLHSKQNVSALFMGYHQAVISGECFISPMPPHVPYGLRGLPSRLRPKCNRILRLRRP
jgi:hypothetical protein